GEDPHDPGAEVVDDVRQTAGVRRRQWRTGDVGEGGHGGYEDGGYEDQDGGCGQHTGGTNDGADQLVVHGGWHLPPRVGRTKRMGRRHQEQPGSRGVEALLPLSDAVGDVNTGRQADPRVRVPWWRGEPETTRPSGAGVLIPCLRRARCWVPNNAPAAGRPPNSDPTGTQQRPTGGAVGSARADRRAGSGSGHKKWGRRPL